MHRVRPASIARVPYHIAPLYKEPGKDKLEVIVPPAGPAGSASMAEGTSAFLLVNTDAEAEAYKFFEFLLSKEGQELGMAVGYDASPIVRLSVNKNVDTLEVYNDEGWNTFAKQYANGGVYFPQVPNWKPIRMMTSEGFNTILSDCNSDIAAGLVEMDATVNAELERQGVLVK